MPFECSSQRQAALIARQINAARLTKCLTLSQLSLRTVPAEVFTLTDLVRLDLGDNHLSELPEQIGQLTSLEQLWLNNNPLAELPPQVEQCTRLRQLDLRATLIKALPRELGRLKNLVDVDILDIPLKTKLANAHAAGGTTNLLKALQDKDVRKTLKIELEKKLADGIYREVRSSFKYRAAHTRAAGFVFFFAFIAELACVMFVCPLPVLYRWQTNLVRAIVFSNL